MRSEGNDFILEGLAADDPSRIKTPEELTKKVIELGFLPLFKNNISGFSVEEMTASNAWFSGNSEDPWAFREVLARDGIVAYGKLFGKKAGFISKQWYPSFANYRRDGYDFDSRYEDGLASQMDQLIYENVNTFGMLASFELKAKICGKSRKGTGFDTSLTRLQMQTYLTVRGFKRKRTKNGEEYGWAAAIFDTPETLFGEEYVRKEYVLDPKESKEKIIHHMQTLYPNLLKSDIEKFLK